MPTPDLPSRYRVIGLLGQGGSGRVYRIYDMVRARTLALKLVSPNEDAFLRREFGTLRQIRHENLIQVFDSGSLVSGEAYYTMELIEGGDWGGLMGSPQSPEETRRLLAGVLRGLAHLHCHGEIHGDLKPGNVLLGLGGVVKLADIGMGGGQDGAAGVSATPGYAAPEVWEGARADERSDLYSVGVIAYEAITGRHPFAGRTVRDVVAGQLEGWVPSPTAHGVLVPADLERVVMRALERDRNLRQATADEFMEGLGLDNRVGRILGGKFVGRKAELAGVLGGLRRTAPDAPILLHITGPSGIGKRTLASEAVEAASRESGAEIVVLPDSAPDPLENLRRDWAGTSDVGDSRSFESLADTVWQRSIDAPLLVCCPRSRPSESAARDGIRSLARFVWALSLERRTPCRALFIEAADPRPPQLEPFESTIPLEPFSRQEVEQQIAGTIGRCEIAAELIARIHTLTGGLPEAVSGAISALIADGWLVRRNGTWQSLETRPVITLELPGVTEAWERAWVTLTREQQAALVVLALLPSGIPQQVSETAQGLVGRATLISLSAMAWARATGARWTLGSESQRPAVLRSADTQLLHEVASRVRAADTAVVSREERADVLLRFFPSSDALEEGMWAAQEAMVRGSYQLTVDRCGALLSLVQPDQGAIRIEIRLMLASSLHSLGRELGALECLENCAREAGGKLPPELHTRWLHLRGLVRGASNDLEGARADLLDAERRARASGDLDRALVMLADVAEMESRLGDQERKAAIIGHIRMALDGTQGQSVTDESRAALSYSLGAALITSGDRVGAKEVLEPALALNCSDYWRMRNLNAMATAEYYLGELHDALEHNALAWQHAVRAGLDFHKPRILGNRAGALYGLGRFSEAAEQDALAATWARRLGNDLELSTASSGAAIDLVALARYGEALGLAGVAEEAALRSQHKRDQAKAQELMALCWYWIGDHERAIVHIDRGWAPLRGEEYLGVGPRLDWLSAKIAAARGQTQKAEELLQKAEEGLARTQDPEDLWGVQIEVSLLRHRQKRESPLLEVGDILRAAEASGLLIVQGFAAAAAAEILADGHGNDAGVTDLLAGVLGRVEGAGMLETAWQTYFWLGVRDCRIGDRRHGRTRLATALRLIRQIADRLSPENRRLYLRAPHIAPAIDAIHKLSESA